LGLRLAAHPAVAPAPDRAALYHDRWELELAFDELKTHPLDRTEARHGTYVLDTGVLGFRAPWSLTTSRSWLFDSDTRDGSQPSRSNVEALFCHDRSPCPCRPWTSLAISASGAEELLRRW
jgi:hypothetical protein